jgi:hypothetical protein
MTAAPTHRLRAADLLDIIERLTTRTATEPSASVEITRNAAGNAQFTVKLYATATVTDEELNAVMARAYDVATEAYDAANAQYPHFDKKKDADEERDARAAAAIARNLGRAQGRPAAVRPRG